MGQELCTPCDRDLASNDGFSHDFEYPIQPRTRNSIQTTSSLSTAMDVGGKSVHSQESFQTTQLQTSPKRSSHCFILKIKGVELHKWFEARIQELQCPAYKFSRFKMAVRFQDKLYRSLNSAGSNGQGDK